MDVIQGFLVVLKLRVGQILVNCVRHLLLQEPGQLVHQHHILDGGVLPSHHHRESFKIGCIPVAQLVPTKTVDFQEASHASAWILAKSKFWKIIFIRTLTFSRFTKDIRTKVLWRHHRGSWNSQLL